MHLSFAAVAVAAAAAAAAGSQAARRSQCRLRNMGMSEKAQKRCVFILALGHCGFVRLAPQAYSRDTLLYLCSLISAIDLIALATTDSEASTGAMAES